MEIRGVRRCSLGVMALIFGAALVSSAGTPGHAAALRAQCCDTHGSISLINPRTNQVTATVHVAGTPSDLAVSRADDAAFLNVIGANRADTTKIFKITPGARVTARPLAVGFEPVDWVLAPAGRYLYLARASRPACRTRAGRWLYLPAGECCTTPR